MNQDDIQNDNDGAMAHQQELEHQQWILENGYKLRAEKMKNIATAFVKAQKEFGALLKDSNNPFFKSKYADLHACVSTVLTALNNNGIGLIQNCHESANGVIVETTFIHESGETINCGRLHVPAIKQDPQQYGSALTYARRYSLMAACGIAPEDDDGNAAVRQEPAKTAPAKTSLASLTPIPSLPVLSIAELNEALKVMGVQTTLESLKNAYGLYYSKASDYQKEILLKRKDEIKSLIESLG